MDLRIVFLILLGITLFLGWLEFVAGNHQPDLPYLLGVLRGTLLLASFLGTTALFFVILFKIDPYPYIRQSAYLLGLRELVLFDEAIPEELIGSLGVADVKRIDTDGDGFLEWVVFYEFDLQNGRNPIKGVVYDNDRGNPPVIFPYALRPPNRDYLSEATTDSLDKVAIRMEQVTGSSEQSEVVISGDRSLNIFEFQQNSEAWDFPRDAPPRYIPIGFFRGSGGVSLDSSSKAVTVIDRDGFERSQLAIRSIFTLRSTVYKIDQTTTKTIESYLDEFDQTKLAAPVLSTIDFFGTPPNDILATAFPEKIVLAFYISTCGSSSDDDLCHRDTLSWQPDNFFAANGESAGAFPNNPAYFGLASFGSTSNLAVTHLRYYPQLESDDDLLPSGCGRDVVTGESPRFNVVDIFFSTGSPPVEQARRFEMEHINGQWKIVRGLDLGVTTLGCPTIVSQN